LLRASASSTASSTAPAGRGAILQKRLVQRDLVSALLLDRPDLRTHQVGAQEIVGDGKASFAVGAEQVKTRIAPEISRNCRFAPEVQQLDDLRLLISCQR